jgi:cytosine/adenosine deaminase-related metal-dependent hydrolase
VVDAQRRGYKGPLERLEALGAIPSGSILAHGIHLEPEAVHRAAQGGAWWVHNPRSNEGNQVGYASSLGACERVALGTDGWPAEMEVEAAALERLGTAAGEDPTQRAERLAQGQRLAAELFDAWPIALAPGSLGDLVVRDDTGVRHVVVHGRVVVRDGLLVGADLADIEVEAAREARGLWRRMAAL